MNFFIGIDLGGTKIAGVLVNDRHEIVKEARIATDTRDQAAVIGCIKAAIDRLWDKDQAQSGPLAGIGIGEAGHVDSEKGMVVYCPNLPIERLNLKAVIQDTYSVPVFIENDANAAAVGEKVFGAARDNRNFVCVTLGTGIGAGIFIDGRIYRGSTGGAGELGHMILDLNPDAPVCGCGNQGCFEALASGIAIARRAAKIFGREEISAHDVARMAQEGNGRARELLADTARIIGIGFANIVNLFNPEKIIVTGSLAESEDLILKPAIETMMGRAFSTNAKVVEVIRSPLKNRAGVLGAAALVILGISGKAGA